VDETISENMPAFDNSVSIIIPTRNEAENVAPLVSQIVSRPVRLQEILFVDDSTDATRNVIRSLIANYPVRLIEHDRARPGLAAAIMSGAEAEQRERSYSSWMRTWVTRPIESRIFWSRC
jgi:glycosyltransferase involved in cell wall biosynthesis